MQSSPPSPICKASVAAALARPMVFLFLMGAALELGQLFSPGRTCDWHDLLANVCGILAGVALVRILQRFTFNSAANGLR